MGTVNPQITIRAYSPEDLHAVREISYQTAFLEKAELFFDDKELVMDALTSSFINYEPQGLFVACVAQKIIGYVMGTTNCRRMYGIFWFKVLPRLLGKVIRRGVLLKRKEAQFFLHVLGSFFKGEFFAPDLTSKYPGLLHINIMKGFRGQHVGEKLISRFIQYLKENQVQGLHVSTFSEEARQFFAKQDFYIVFSRNRSYLRYRLGKNIRVYIMTRMI